jgi:hypothetical protein
MKWIMLLFIIVFVAACTKPRMVTNSNISNTNTSENKIIIVEIACVKIHVPPDATFCLNDFDCFKAHTKETDTTLWVDNECKGNYAKSLPFNGMEQKIEYGTFEGDTFVIKGSCSFAGDLQEAGLLSGTRNPRDICCNIQQGCGERNW